MKFKRRTGSVPVPLKTHQISKSEIYIPGPLVTPLTPKTERELRKSCSLLFATAPPASSRHSKSKSRSQNDSLPVPLSKDDKYLHSHSLSAHSHSLSAHSNSLSAHSNGHSRGPSNPRTPRHIEEVPIPSALPRTPRTPNLRAHPPQSQSRPKTPTSTGTKTPLSTSSSTSSSPPAYAFAKTATARKVSVSNALELLPPPAPATTRKPSLVLSTIDIPASSDNKNNSNENNNGAGNRASQVPVLLARPTLVTVSSPSTSQRPKTSGTPRTPTPGPDWNTEFKARGRGSPACERLSLFPRPRTAGGAASPIQADRPLPPLPSQNITQAKRAKTDVVEISVPTEKKSRFPGLAFWKGLRFGGSKKNHSVGRVQVGLQAVA